MNSTLLQLMNRSLSTTATNALAQITVNVKKEVTGQRTRVTAHLHHLFVDWPRPWTWRTRLNHIGNFQRTWETLSTRLNRKIKNQSFIINLKISRKTSRNTKVFSRANFKLITCSTSRGKLRKSKGNYKRRKRFTRKKLNKLTSKFTC